MNDLIRNSLTIIENNLNDKLTLDFLSNQLGYSKYHFSKLFKKHMGLTVLSYITNRKLINSAVDILRGDSITNVAMSYGYETHSGFSKAFVKKFGFPPNMLHVMRSFKALFSETGGIIMNEKALHEKLRMSLLTTLSGNQLLQFDTAYSLVSESVKDIKRYSGEAYITHQLNISLLLEQMDMPFETILLGMMHEALQKNSAISRETIIKEFGLNLYEKINSLEKFSFTTDINQLAKEYSDDIIMVKLVDRLHSMKTLKHLSPNRWQVKAEETIKYFMPLAETLGLEEFKLELEHLSLQYLK